MADVAVEVLVGEQWLPGWLTRWQHRSDGSWHGDVEWTRMVRPAELNSPFVPATVVDEAMPFTWCKTLPAQRIRRREDG